MTAADGGWQVWHPSRVRPLAYFTLWLNYQMAGQAPLVYHATNLVLHLVSVWLAGLALARLLPGRAALLATAIFALHPVQTEAVAYVFARSTLLCGLWCLAALAAWTRGRHGWAVICHALAMLAKEEAAALPVVIALLHWSISRNHREWRPIAAMLAVSLAVGGRGLLVTLTQPGTGAVADAGISPGAYFLTQSQVLARYGLQLVMPVGLNFDPDIAVAEPWRGAALWMVWLGVIGWAARRFAQGGPGFWILAALVFLAPTSTFLPIADLSADRRLYLAVMAVAAALASWIAPRVRLGIIGAVALVLSVASFNRSLVWQTEESLWSDTVAKSPAKVRPRVQLARAVRPEEALRLLHDLKDPLAEAERGRLYLELGRAAEALDSFGKVLAARPGDPGALTNRGAALAALGQTEAARADWLRALERDPCYPPALRNLGRPLCPR